MAVSYIDQLNEAAKNARAQMQTSGVGNRQLGTALTNRFQGGSQGSQSGSNYTYDQFLSEAQNAGMYDQFSTADLNLAKTNPDAGMSILKYKQDYANAPTDEARELANLGAENIRSSYGGYTGGGDGGSFALTQLSPGSFSYDKAPEFEYDPDTDPVYAAYQKQYAREGQRATQDTLGAAAAATGGIPSSYAVTAAGQAGDYYAAQMADKIPELYQQAYDRYLAELTQYNTDRNFAYGQHLDEIDSQTLERQEALEKAILAADYGDYSGLNDMGIDTSNNPTDWERQYQLALLAAENGDYSGLQKLGIDTSNADYDKLYNEALLAAEYGDYSKLQAMGIDTSNADYEKRYNEALLAAEYGDYSKLQAMGIDTSNNPTDRDWQYDLALLKAQYGDYSGLQALGVNTSALEGSGSSGSGYYYSGGSSSGGSSSESAASTQAQQSGGTASISVADQLDAEYPDGNIPSRDVPALKLHYGISLETLKNMGFTINTTVKSS